VLCSKFASRQLKPLLERIQPLLAKLPAQAVAGLAVQLAARAGVVWGGAEAAAEELGQLAAMGESAEVEQQQQQVEQQRQEQQDASAAGAEQEQEAAVAGDAADDSKQGKTKRDLFHSSQSRKAALLQLATQPAAGKGAKRRSGAAAAAAAAQRAKERAPGARLAAWLAPALRALMATPPTKLPGECFGGGCCWCWHGWCWHSSVAGWLAAADASACLCACRPLKLQVLWCSPAATPAPWTASQPNHAR
jgi:hypothetical protein